MTTNPINQILGDLEDKLQATRGSERIYWLYLLQKVVEGDLHGISDAANDMRVKGYGLEA